MSNADRPLSGKVAWVTGSSRGLGRVIATHLGSLGAAVVVHGTTPTSAQAFNEAASLDDVAAGVARDSGAEVLRIWGDVTNQDHVTRMVGEVQDRFGRIDILVNNAGGDIGAAGTGGPGGGKPQPNDAVFIPLPDVRAVMDRNFMSCVMVCKAVVPGMMERKQGWVVNIASVAAHRSREQLAIYGAAKAAVTHYSRSLADQLRPYNIPVNVISPGGTVTPRFLATNNPDPAKVGLSGTLDRYAEPIEVARAVAFLVADPGAFVSGQVIRVDGGSQLWPA
ncbi:MAG: SDR family oxidoreductase [Chloroflexota bacterium]